MYSVVPQTKKGGNTELDISCFAYKLSLKLLYLTVVGVL